MLSLSKGVGKLLWSGNQRTLGFYSPDQPKLIWKVRAPLGELNAVGRQRAGGTTPCWRRFVAGPSKIEMDRDLGEWYSLQKE